MPHEKNEYYIHKLQLDAADHTTEESIKYWKGHFDYLQNRIAECQNIIASPNQTQEAIDKEKFAINTLTQDTRDTVQKLINLGYHEILNQKMTLWEHYYLNEPKPDSRIELIKYWLSIFHHHNDRVKKSYKTNIIQLLFNYKKIMAQRQADMDKAKEAHQKLIELGYTY